MPQVEAAMLNAVIANGASLSNAVQVGKNYTIGIVMPTIDVGVITFQVSMDGVTFVELFKADGSTAVSIPSSTGGKAVDTPPELNGKYNFIKLRTGTVGVPVVQTAQRTFQVASE